MVILRRAVYCASILAVTALLAGDSSAQTRGDSQSPPEQTATQSNVPTNDNSGSVPTVTVNIGQEAADDERREPSQPRQPENEVWPNRIIAVLTFVLAVLGGLQWWTTKRLAGIATEQNAIVTRQNTIMARQNAMTQTIERAYVSITHDKPGIWQFIEGGPDPRAGDGPIAIMDGMKWSVSLKFVNTGKTPADIVDLTMCPVIGKALPPTTPDRSPITTTQRINTIAPADHFFNWQLNDPLASDVLTAINAGESKLWIIATVTYVDRFGKGHRVGFARRYVPNPVPGTKNNLLLGEGTEDGYIYDVDVEVKPNQQGTESHP